MSRVCTSTRPYRVTVVVLNLVLVDPQRELLECTIASSIRIQQNFPSLYFCRYLIFWGKNYMDELRTPRRVRNYPQNCKGSTNKKFIYYGGFWCFCSEYFWFCCEIVCFGLDCPIFLDSGPIFTPFRPKYSLKIGRSDTLQVALQETCRINAK